MELKMPKKIITYVTFIAFLHMVGCYTYDQVNYSEFREMDVYSSIGDDIFLHTKDSLKYHMSKFAFNVKDDTLHFNGALVVGEQEIPNRGTIPVENIESIEILKADGTKTAIMIGGVTLALILIALASSHS